MKNNKKQPKNTVNLTPSIKELAAEERAYNACKKPIKIAWTIYAFAATIYLCSGIFANAAIKDMPELEPLDSTLHEHKYSDAYSEFKSELETEAYNKMLAGEITADEYKYTLKTISDDKKFEEFLRTLESDPEVQKALAEYDDYNSALDRIGKTYSALAITSLSSLLVSTIILAKYRFREMDIEEKRKKRDEAANTEKQQ